MPWSNLRCICDWKLFIESNHCVTQSNTAANGRFFSAIFSFYLFLPQNVGIPSCIITLVAFDWQFFRSLYWDKSLRDPIQQVKQRKTDFSLTTFLSFYLASVSFLITKHRSTFFLDFLWFSFQKLVLTQVIACSETIEVFLRSFFCHQLWPGPLLLKMPSSSEALIWECNWFSSSHQRI